MYPKPTLQDLGEHHEELHEPETIKIIKTLKLEIPKPYPVHVPHKVPYPVAVKVPHIIKVPHVVKVSQPVPVEVVKHVPVQQDGHQEQQQDGYGGGYAGYGSSYGAQLTGTSGYGSQDAYGSHQVAITAPADNSQQQGSYGASAASYALPDAQSYGAQSYGGQSFGGQSYGPQSYAAQSYGGDQSSFVPSYQTQGAVQGSDESNSVNSYQSYQVQNQYGGEQSDQQGDHSVQASSSAVMQEQPQDAAYMVSAGYQVKDSEQSDNQKQ